MMGFYLAPLSFPRCASPGCGRPARVRLFNTFNAPLNEYCARHGKTALRDAEARDRARTKTLKEQAH